jgi:hypothetical protein
LEPCLKAASEDHDLPLNCKENFTQEVTDILQFRFFVQDLWGYPDNATASGALVSFHDLVTKSIGKEYLLPERKNLYCLSQVMDSLRTNSNLDLGHDQLDVPLMVAQKVPGLGSQAQPRC